MISVGLSSSESLRSLVQLPGYCSTAMRTMRCLAMSVSRHSALDEHMNAGLNHAGPIGAITEPLLSGFCGLLRQFVVMIGSDSLGENAAK